MDGSIRVRRADVLMAPLRTRLFDKVGNLFQDSASLREINRP
jgi:hypothetical protein